MILTDCCLLFRLPPGTATLAVKVMLNMPSPTADHASNASNASNVDDALPTGRQCPKITPSTWPPDASSPTPTSRTRQIQEKGNE